MSCKPRKKTDKEKALALSTLRPGDKGVNFESVVREEYMKLHRTYRLMEDVRHTILEKDNKVGKHGRLLEFLADRNEDARLDLRNAASESWKKKDKRTVRTMLSILEHYENCLQKIAARSKDIHEMETNVDNITKRLIEQNLKVLAVYGRSLTEVQATRKKARLEDHLFQTVMNFDKRLIKNENYRNQIDLLLKERKLFHSHVVSLRRHANHIKRGMGEIVFSATRAYEQRDDIVAKIHAMRERNEKESKQHVLELKEFNRVLHHDSKLHGFMNAKNKHRSLIESNIAREERKNHDKLTQLVRTLEAYEKTFEEILKIDEKGLNSEELVLKYLDNEQSNFMNFCFLTDLNNEIDSLYYNIRHLAEEISEMNRHNKKKEIDHSAHLDKIVQLFQEKGQELDQIIDIWEQSEIQLEEFIHLLDIVFKAANCDNTPVIRLLGNVHGITPHNAVLCMKVIETRVAELIFHKQELEIRKAVEINKANLPKPVKGTPVHATKLKSTGGPFLPDLLITGRIEAGPDEDDRAHYSRPYEYEELRYKLLERQTDVKVPRPTLNAQVLRRSAAHLSQTPEV